MGNAPAPPRVALVTGVSGLLGGRLAQALQRDPRIERVIGVDTSAPQGPLGRTEFVSADIRTPAIASVLRSAQVDTVVHVGLVNGPGAAGGSAPRKQINVIGTMQLLAACQRTASVRRFVARSTAAVYGSSPHAPALFTETMEPGPLPRHGYAKDAWEVEGYLRGVARRRPDVSVTTLRFANFVGPDVHSPLTLYFSLPVVPTVLGFDPRLQFVHEDDGVEVLRRMAVEDHPGVFNVSGEGVMMLSQALRRTGRPTVPVPQQGFQVAGGVLRRAGLADFSPEQAELLSYGRAVDSARLVAELDWQPTYTTGQAFDDFARNRELGPPGPVDPVGWVDQLARAAPGCAGVRQGPAAAFQRRTEPVTGSLHACR